MSEQEEAGVQALVGSRDRRRSSVGVPVDDEYLDSILTLERTVFFSSVMLHTGAALIVVLEKSAESMLPLYPLVFLLVLVSWILSLGSGRWQLTLLNLVCFSLLPLTSTALIMVDESTREAVEEIYQRQGITVVVALMLAAVEAVFIVAMGSVSRAKRESRDPVAWRVTRRNSPRQTPLLHPFGAGFRCLCRSADWRETSA